MRHSPHQLISGGGKPPDQGPSCNSEGAGSKEDGTHLLRGVLQPCDEPVTHPPWIGLFLSSDIELPFQSSAFGHNAGLKIAPEGDQKLARHGDNSDTSDAAPYVPNTLVEPNAQRTCGLMPQPQPRELNYGRARLSVAGLTDPLITARRAALEMTRRQTDIVSKLLAVVERSIEHFTDKRRRRLRADPPDLDEVLDLFRVGVL